MVWLGSIQLSSGAEVLSSYTCPPEWARQQAIWLGFRTFKEGLNNEPLLGQMLAPLSAHAHVNLVIESPELFPDSETYFSRLGISPSNYSIILSHPAFFWLRDSGPTFLKSRQGRIALSGTPYSGWLPMNAPGTARMVVDHRYFVSNIAAHTRCSVLPADIVLEGGSYEVNGEGVVLLSPVILERNPGYTRWQIERKIIKILGQKKAIWMAEGMAEDPYGFSRISGNYWARGTGGHLDEYVRFVNTDTILLAWIPADAKDANTITSINHYRLKENLRILKQATDCNGKNFTVIKAPVPDLITRAFTVSQEQASLYAGKGIEIHEGDELSMVATTSYLNFIIANDLILLPRYGNKKSATSVLLKDEKMLKIMETLFPRHNIVQLNPLSLNWHGGGMHCITQQQPAGRNRHVTEAISWEKYKLF